MCIPDLLSSFFSSFLFPSDTINRTGCGKCFFSQSPLVEGADGDSDYVCLGMYENMFLYSLSFSLNIVFLFIGDLYDINKYKILDVSSRDTILCGNVSNS